MTKKKTIFVYLSGKIAENIIKESKAIGEPNAPSFWVNKHFHEYFKLDKKEK